MTRDEYLDELRGCLSRLEPGEVKDILRDQEEYIREAVAAGRSESEVLASLGSPKNFAAGVTAEAKIAKAQNSADFNLKAHAGATVSAVVAVLALAPLNLIFVLGPFLGLLGLVFGCWVATLSLIATALFLLVAFAIKFVFLPVSFLTHLSAITFLFGWVGVGILGTIFMVYVSRAFFGLALAYLQWNLRFVKGRI